MSSTTHSTALPSTPNSIGRSSNLFGKVLNKLRTPTGGDGVNGANSHENQNSTPKRSFSPMMGRRSSSKSSLRMFGSSSRAGNANSHPLPSSSTNTSTSSLALPHPNNSSLEFDDDDDSLDLPQFESDKYAPSTTASNRASSPYSRNFPSSSSLASVAAVPSSTDVAPPNQHQLPPRPSTSMSTRSRAGSASNGTGSAGSGWKSALLGRSTGAVGTRSASVASQASHIEGNEGMSSSWSKSKNLAKSFGRSTGGDAAREVRDNEGASEDVTHKVVQHSSPNDSHRPSLSESSRTTRPHLASVERNLPPSQPDPFDSGTTPGLPRNGLSRSAAPSTTVSASAANAGASVGRKNWLASRGTAGVTGRARRVVQRVPEPLPLEPDMLVSNEPERGSVMPQGPRMSPERPSPAQLPSTSRPSLSPNGHGRSRSELPPSSPKLVQSSERGAATLTLNSSSYLRKHQLDSSRPASSLAHHGTKELSQEREDLPSSKSAASAAASATFSQMRATQAPSNSTAFRNRFLRGESSTSLSSSSSNNSPDLPSFSSTASDPSPPLRNAPLASSTTQPHPLSNPSHGRTVSGSIKLNPMGSGLARKTSVSLLNGLDQPNDSPPPPPVDPRRMDASSRAAAQIAQARASIEESRGVESEEIVPYASRRTSVSRTQGDTRYDQHRQLQQQDTVTAGSSTLVGSITSSLKRSNSETLMASSLSSTSSQPPHTTIRPASSMSLYRDEPSSQPPAESALDYRQPIPSHQNQVPAFPSTSLPPMQPYRDENVYDGRSTVPSSYSHQPAPTHQSNPSHIASQPLHQQPSSFPSSQAHSQSTLPNGRQVLGEVNRGYPLSTVGPPQPSTVQQGQRGYGGGGGGKAQDFQVPLRDRSPGIAEATPSYTAQQHHYQSQQAYQHQQQHVHLSQQQGMMYPGQVPPMTEQSHAEPIKRLPKHIMVNGKAYHRAGILGRGGSSKVYRVIAAHNNEICALKKVDTRNDAESRASFINEITLLKKLSGKPEIIQLIDAEVQSRYVYMVMEAGDTDLNSLLAGYSGLELSLNRVRYIWEQMLCAVQVIHEESIVHSDLKPANFVVVKGRVKLIDFGISKAIAADTTNIGRDQQIGTANYMPPEALLDTGLGDDGKRLMKLGRPADVWELGCILYQLVYGQQPFAHIRDLSSKILMIQNPLHRINYPPYSVPKGPRGEELTDLKTKVGPDLLQTMQSCLRYNPKQRATIPELLQQPFLRRSGDEEPVAVTSIPPGSTTVNESEMAILTQRIAFMLGGQGAMDRLLKNPTENADLARKLMGELQQLKNP